MNDEQKRLQEIKELYAEQMKFLASTSIEPPMGWLEFGTMMAQAEKDGRTFYYFNGGGRIKLFIGEQPKKYQGRCGAKTRSRTPCKMRVVGGKQRCRLHGGMSTGPRTRVGRARIAASNRRRAKAHKVTNDAEQK